MEKQLPRICIVTSTRADWGLLMPLARELRASGKVVVQIVATNMHMLKDFGNTAKEISDAGFDVDAFADMYIEGDSPLSRAKAMAKCTGAMADAFSKLAPDTVLLLGDRYEILATASTAAVMGIPVIHIAGGEISEGALDDSFRHAITKLSSLHLTATEPYRRRVIQMGEEPETVINTGAIGVWNALNTKLMSREQLFENLGIDFGDRPIAMVTFHPVTNEPGADSAMQMKALLDALNRFPQLGIVITAPNNDAGGMSLLHIIEDYASSKNNVLFIPSLGMVRYHSMLRYAAFCIGNSSSGIVEVPSAGIPTVNIGTRQKNRIAAPSVIHCGTSENEITAAIEIALSPDMCMLAAKKENPYFKPDTLAIMTKAVLDFATNLPVKPKHFHDIP
ncbi:MAG: UDP-N-acetylglucosamine 2-epimerase (hydrolyzing) [Muribaculaceae bacterium]|nr:UDP-N-acetylglucosamine 2-epimerase (hydrolyzing) [Muribaculaceae bacterium]